MRKKKQNHTVYILLAGLLGLSISLQFDVLGKVAYALERGRIKADFDHLATVNEADVATLEEVSYAFGVLVEATKPSVVNIQALTNDETIERLFEKHKLQAPPMSGAGSGVIIDREGHIITNNHVVADAEVINVSLADGRKFRATIVGADEKTDLAVIKIAADHLHPARFGDSDLVKAGHIVLAIGSPFRLGHSVSHGIVSAIGRSDVKVDIDYQNFIQTDAPINPGNSGGPLLNARGEVIGITTAIATETGGHQGVGFAIPANTVVHVAEFLRSGDQIVRGYLGVGIKPVDHKTAQAYGLDLASGVFIQAVGEDSPAADAGLRPEDIVLAINNKNISTVETLQERIATTPPNKEITITVWRNLGNQEYGRVQLAVTVGAQPEQFSTRGPLRNLDLSRPGQGDRIELPPLAATPTTDRTPFDIAGFEATTVSPSISKEYFLEPDIRNGAIITYVSPTSEAYAANLRPGQVITRANDSPVGTIAELEKIMTTDALSQGIRLQLRAGVNTHFAVLQVR